MDNANIKKNAVTFGTARNNLLLVVAFTFINIMLIAFESDFYLLFSARLPVEILLAFQSLTPELGAAASTIGMLVALFGVFLYFLCWLLSKRIRAFILVALIFFTTDTVLFLMLIGTLIMFGDIDFFVIVAIAFYGWILFYLITGTVAWAKLRGITPEQLEGAKTAVDNEIASTMLNQISENDEDKGDDK